MLEFSRRRPRAAASGRRPERSDVPPMPPAHAPRRLTIATRESALALWQAEHIRARLAALYPANDVRPARHDDGGRPDPRPAARRDRRQGPLHQGARSGDGRRPRRPRRAFAEGRADGHAARDSRSPPSPRARTRATRSCRIAIATCASLPAGAVVGTSSLRREAQLRERYPLLVDPAAARQRQHAAAQARRGAVRRDHPRRGRV